MYGTRSDQKCWPPAGVIDDIYGASFVNGAVSGNPQDQNGHGTFVAGEGQCCLVAASLSDVDSETACRLPVCRKAQSLCGQ